jgi:membrane-associated protease RseP (regulator of RpoE activity)
LLRLGAFALIGSALAAWLLVSPAGFAAVLLNLAIFMVILTVVVGVHEFCHLLAALALKVEVNAFAIGFGPELVGRTFKNIRWSLNALWIGGYVKLQGENKEEGPRSFAAARTWKKVVILVVGPLSNILLAFLILVVLVAIMKPGVSVDKYFGAAFQILALIWTGTINAIASFLPIATKSPLDMPLVGIPGMIAAPGQMLNAPGGGPFLVVILAAAISFSMGIINLLPLVPLDGGQAFVAILKGVLGRFYPERAMSVVMVGMFALVLAFIVTVNGIDLLRTVIGYTVH